MPSPTTFSIFIAIILASIVVVSKLRKTLRGSKVRQKPLIAITLVQLGLTSYFVLSSLFIGIPIIFLILYAILFILAQFISYRYSDRALSFWKTPDGSVFWKGGLNIHLVYIVSFVIRSAISLFLLGSGLFRFDIIQTARLAGQGATLLSSIIITDSLMIIGLGLLIGMNRRILTHYKLIMKSEETP